jgi:ribosome-binding ATPase YchF (GTP1/OBG family)
MAFTPTEKEKFLAALIDTRSAGQTAEIRLRFQEKADEAEQVREACDRLTDEIDTLTGELMNDWLGNANKAIADLAKKSAVIDDAVADIKKKLKIAQKVVKLIGGIDDAVAIAKKALTAL